MSDTAIAGSQTTTAITVIANGIAATLNVGNSSLTFDGSPHAAVVTTNPAGLTGVIVTYIENGVPVAKPTQAGDYTVTATLDNPLYSAPATTATLVISQATPIITWAAPANITAGIALGSAQLDAVASFDGTAVPGNFTYTPAAGTVLAAGNGQLLSVIFIPADSTDFKTATASVAINVTPPPTIIESVQPVFRRKLKKNGKPTGKEILTGFTVVFNTQLSTAAATDVLNYQLDTVTNKKVGKSLDHTLHPVKHFTVVETLGSAAVTLKLTAAQTFPTGGRIRVLPGVTGGTDSVLSGTTVFTIAPGGKKVKPS